MHAGGVLRMAANSTGAAMQSINGALSAALNRTTSSPQMAGVLANMTRATLAPSVVAALSGRADSGGMLRDTLLSSLANPAEAFNKLVQQIQSMAGPADSQPRMADGLALLRANGGTNSTSLVGRLRGAFNTTAGDNTSMAADNSSTSINSTADAANSGARRRRRSRFMFLL